MYLIGYYSVIIINQDNPVMSYTQPLHEGAAVPYFSVEHTTFESYFVEKDLCLYSRNGYPHVQMTSSDDVMSFSVLIKYRVMVPIWETTLVTRPTYRYGFVCMPLANHWALFGERSPSSNP
jgi:hypothetical protein